MVRTTVPPPPLSPPPPPAAAARRRRPLVIVNDTLPHFCKNAFDLSYLDYSYKPLVITLIARGPSRQFDVPLNTRIGTIYEDVTTDVLGTIGSWQWLITYISTALMISNIFNYYDEIFLLRLIVSDLPDGIICSSSETYSLPSSSNDNLCLIANDTIKYECDSWHVKLMGIVWIKRSWIILCSDRLKLLSMSMISRLGSAFGCVISGIIADSFGRKRIIVIAVILEIPLWSTITFCDFESWFRLVLFIRSLVSGAHVYMGIIIICEIASNVWRSKLMTIVSLPRAVAAFCMVPLLQSIPNVETYSMMACIYSLMLGIVLRWVPESPQWLLFNRRVVCAEKMLKNAAKKNSVRLCEDFKIRPVNHRAYQCLEDSSTCFGIMTKHNIRVTMFVTLMLWCLFEFIWSFQYLLLYNESYSEHITLAILCTVILFGSLTLIAAQKCKLRHLLLLHVTITGSMTSLFIFVKQSSNVIRFTVATTTMSSGIVGRLLILNITPRLFAIDIRATTFGCCHASGQIGAMISFILFALGDLETFTAFSIILAFTLALCILIFFLLDIDGRELPDVLQDMDYFMELTKPLRWACQKTDNISKEEVQLDVYSFSSGGQGSNMNSEEQPPARPIGLTQTWRRVAKVFKK